MAHIAPGALVKVIVPFPKVPGPLPDFAFRGDYGLVIGTYVLGTRRYDLLVKGELCVCNAHCIRPISSCK